MKRSSLARRVPLLAWAAISVGLLACGGGEA